MLEHVFAMPANILYYNFIQMDQVPGTFDCGSCHILTSCYNQHTMTFCNYRINSIKRYTRLVLVMFVISVLNISLQLPVHAAMQQNMQMSHDMAMMDHSQMDSMDMSDCGCPPALCETVDAQQDQLGYSQSAMTLADTFEFFPILVIIENDNASQLADISLHYQSWQYHQVSPPPIQFTTELQI